MALATYTDQEMVNNIRSTIYDLVSGGAESRELNGRVWTALDIDALQTMEKFYTDKVGSVKNRVNLTGFRNPS